jgi:hypothetical protein
MKTERISLGPDLGATIHTHDITVDERLVPAWTMVTNGLSAFNQQEIAFTILRPGDQRPFPEGVLNYVPALEHFASEGRIVRDGDISGYRAPGPFQLGAFVGVAFLTPEPLPGIDLPRDALAGVFLTEGELAMASGCSVRRVLNRLGKQACYFPTPYWSDPSRASVYSPSDVERSILVQFARAKSEQATATLSGDVMQLSLPTAFAAGLADHLEKGQPVAVLPGRARGVPAALVWSPGQTEPEAIMVGGTQPTVFSSTFVALVPNEAPSDEVRFMEDGYAVLLSSASMARLAGTLRGRGTMQISNGQRTLRVIVT